MPIPSKKAVVSYQLRAWKPLTGAALKSFAPKDEYTASVYGAYRTTSDLTCALIEGTTNNAFQVTLPDGEYTIWLIANDAEWDPPLFEVWANGEKKLDVRIPRAVRLHGT